MNKVTLAQCVVVVSALLAFSVGTLRAEPGEYFKILVVDADTGRGVPMVELRTTANHFFITDSGGIVAFNEPGLMGRDVFFHVQSHGYEYPKDSFGFAGTRVHVERGRQTTIKIKRVNLAERLYRVTGYGIYRDTVLLGELAPIKSPVLNALVTGSDSVQTTVYEGLLYWFWGDTNRPRYPLGSFHVPGATSVLERDGGLNPSVGIDLDYFVDEEGFAARTAQMGERGFTWMSGLTTLKDQEGRDRMFAHFVRGVSDPQTMWKILDRGVMEWDPEATRFEKVSIWQMDGPFPDGAHTFLHDGYVYFCDPFPRWRVPATSEAFVDQSSYESYAFLKAGTREPPDGDDESLFDDRFGWKKNTATLGYGNLERLVKSGRIDRGDYPWAMTDVDTNGSILPHRGSVAWNEFRKRWIMIYGISPDLGQIYYAEADSPVGPWSKSKKVITHHRYSFYNPVHHPELDQEGGREIYFEGTYTTSFSPAPIKTPLYDYNQIMYRLDLGDPRLKTIRD